MTHGDEAHDDSHGDSHGDLAHEDGIVGGSDYTHVDVPHTDTHTDSHTDVAHTDSHSTRGRSTDGRSSGSSVMPAPKP